MKRTLMLTPENLAALNMVLNLAVSNILGGSFTEEDPVLVNEREQQVNACEVIQTLLRTPIDPKQEKYLADQRCPMCGDHDVEAVYGTFDGAIQRVQCNVCDAYWHDVYKLIDIVDIQPIKVV